MFGINTLKNIMYKMKRKRLLDNLMLVKCRIKKMGDEYGGYDVAIDRLNADKIINVLSFGIGEDTSFDEDIINSFNAYVYAFDPTPKSVNYIKKSALTEDARFHFYPFGISHSDGKQEFYMPKNKSYVSCSAYRQNAVCEEFIYADMLSFDSIINNISIDYVDLLKMDIEGSEFEVIGDVVSSDTIVDQICIELHDRLFDYKAGLEKLRCFVECVKAHYYIASISDDYQELTLVRK